MYLSHLKIKNHPILGDIEIDLINPKTGKPYSVVAFVGENGCGKTTILNEIFDYESSKYFIDKEKEHPFSIAPYSALYLRQNSLAKNALKETRKLIDGKDLYPVNSTSYMVQAAKTMGPLLDLKEGIKILETLGDGEILKLFLDDCVSEVYCSQDLSKVIDGKEHGYDVSKYSSGQQEILLKLKDLKEFYANTDSVLLDEPETSLHPRWQKEIVNIIRLLLTDINGGVPQIFLATHSEKVLQSIIGMDDALIIRFYKEKGKICYETANQMSLVLPKTSFAELDYVIFKIDSYEYCSELFDLLEWRLNVKGDYGVDRAIIQSEFCDENVHYKEWFNDKLNKVTTKSLPVYVRNYFHHPKDREEPTPKQLHDSIELLRNVILNLNKK